MDGRDIGTVVFPSRFQVLFNASLKNGRFDALKRNWNVVWSFI